MLRVILGRLAVAVPVLLIMTILTYFLVSLIPGNAATVILGQDATPAKIAALNRQLGLDQPFYVQYWHWLVGVFHGNLGTSIYTGETVTRVLSQRIAPTLLIAGFATLVAAAMGIVMGAWAAVRKGATARALDLTAMLGISLPNYWISLLLIVFVSGRLHWLPSLGYVDPSTDTAGWASHMVLPVAALAVAGVAIIAKQTHDSMRAALSRDFMRFLQANGISRTRLVLRHGLRHAAIPVVAAIAGCFVNLFGGTVALETVFAIPGLGSLIVTSTTQHDLTAIQGAVLAYTVIILLTTVVAEILYAALNPKVRAAR